MRRLLTPALVVALALSAPPAARAGQDNPADRLLDQPTDAYRADRATGCANKEQPGALALDGWLAERMPVGEQWGIEKCRRVRGGQSWSLHAEGRAIDWKLDVDVSSERRAGDRLVSLLLRRDRRGRPNALARRMGLQEVIWNCRIWTPLSTLQRPYAPCAKRKVDRTMAHRDHVHIGLNWPGALMKTTFWRSYLPEPPSPDPSSPSPPPGQLDSLARSSIR